MKRPPVNKASRPFGYDLLTRKGVQRFTDRVDQRLGTFADEIIREVVIGMFTAFTARRTQRSMEPARIRQRGSKRR